jgi:hypothetical protein
MRANKSTEGRHTLEVNAGRNVTLSMLRFKLSGSLSAFNEKKTPSQMLRIHSLGSTRTQSLGSLSISRAFQSVHSFSTVASSIAYQSHYNINPHIPPPDRKFPLFLKSVYEDEVKPYSAVPRLLGRRRSPSKLKGIFTDKIAKKANSNEYTIKYSQEFIALDSAKDKKTLETAYNDILKSCQDPIKLQRVLSALIGEKLNRYQRHLAEWIAIKFSLDYPSRFPSSKVANNVSERYILRILGDPSSTQREIHVARTIALQTPEGSEKEALMSSFSLSELAVRRLDRILQEKLSTLSKQRKGLPTSDASLEPLQIEELEVLKTSKPRIKDAAIIMDEIRHNYDLERVMHVIGRWDILHNPKIQTELLKLHSASPSATVNTHAMLQVLRQNKIEATQELLNTVAIQFVEAGMHRLALSFARSYLIDHKLPVYRATLLAILRATGKSEVNEMNVTRQVWELMGRKNVPRKLEFAFVSACIRTGDAQTLRAVSEYVLENG